MFLFQVVGGRKFWIEIMVSFYTSFQGTNAPKIAHLCLDKVGMFEYFTIENIIKSNPNKNLLESIIFISNLNSFTVIYCIINKIIIVIIRANRMVGLMIYIPVKRINLGRYGCLIE